MDRIRKQREGDKQEFAEAERRTQAMAKELEGLGLAQQAVIDEHALWTC